VLDLEASLQSKLYLEERMEELESQLKRYAEFVKKRAFEGHLKVSIGSFGALLLIKFHGRRFRQHHQFGTLTFIKRKQMLDSTETARIPFSCVQSGNHSRETKSL
jgi:hypothetical protein